MFKEVGTENLNCKITKMFWKFNDFEANNSKTLKKFQIMKNWEF
jgi:hypothetical protein